MRSSGIVRRIDDLGRVVVPSGMRKILNISKGDSIEVFMENGTICFRKYYPEDNCKMLVSQAVEALQGDDTADKLIKQKLEEVLKMLG